uniref:Isopenicillin N synthase-like Fe(2+) 2OG dioxygenase domain-containing protein n=1 Tax=Paramoeba aestuarina TaxID=180227 RepID=A0A7S4N8D6_9EUKA|mmetsp:Transcript_12483/g.19082  ORF Transcript_12483/g.19082 Transcript_12483/m.19082 type:complete len:455 (+) Transcript_12483:195-1559(+)
MLHLCTSVSPFLFSSDATEIGKKYNVPMLRSHNHPKAQKGGPGEGRFGMLDVAYYFNSGSFKLPNCKKHSDPGLLSLSVVSTAPGLQLFKRKSDEWVDAPTGVGNNIAVLWGGTLIETITDGRLKSGIHRVKSKPNSPPRLAMWLECICEFQDLALTAPLLQQTLVEPAGGTSNNKMKKKKANRINETVLDDMIEDSLMSGIPMSKTEPENELLITDFDDNGEHDLKLLTTRPTTKLTKMMDFSEFTGIPVSKVAFTPDFNVGSHDLKPSPKPAKTELTTRVDQSQMSGIPMSKAPPSAIMADRVNLAMKSRHDGNNVLTNNNANPFGNNNINNNLLEREKTKSKRSGVPMSKSGRPINRGAPIEQLERITKLPKTPIPNSPGQFKKNATPQQFQEMKEHTSKCNNAGCYVVWTGMWGPFIGGRDGDVDFALSECPIAKWMNETIGWDYQKPAC